MSTTPTLPPDFPQAVTTLLELYKENTAHGRHLETQRQLVSGLVLTVAAAVIGALAALKFLEGVCFLLGWVLVGFGLLGTAFSIVQYGKYTQNRERFRALRNRLNELCPTAGLSAIINEARSKKRGWGRVGNFPLHWLWTLLNVCVLIMGGFLVIQYFGAGLHFWNNVRQPTAASSHELKSAATNPRH